MAALSLLIPIIGPLLDKIIPDAGKAAEAKLKVLDLAQTGELAVLDADLKLALGQLEVNKAEVSSDDRYTRRWRPTIGYVLGLALAFQYLINPLMLWVAAIYGSAITPPQISLDNHLWELIMGMLGLAGWRTVDKVKAAQMVK